MLSVNQEIFAKFFIAEIGGSKMELFLFTLNLTASI